MERLHNHRISNIGYLRSLDSFFIYTIIVRTFHLPIIDIDFKIKSDISSQWNYKQFMFYAFDLLLLN